MPQFDRKWKVQVSDIETERLAVSFNVVKTTKKDPNTCILKIRNLNESNRAKLAQLEEPFVKIQAGYADGIGLIFSGNLRDVNSTQEGPDWITEFGSGDGEKAIQTARVNESFSNGTRLDIPIRKLCEKMGIGIGNSAIKALQANFDGAANEFLNGAVLSGRASTEMDGLLKSAGLEWSIQDGELQLMRIGEALEGIAVKLAPDTGLIGSPSVGAKGIVKARSLLNYTIVPGRRLFFDASTIPTGFYRAERCEYIGDSAGQDWYVDIEAKQL